MRTAVRMAPMAGMEMQAPLWRLTPPPPVQKMDPQLRKLLEVSYEAWMDSGINHMAMRGSNKVRKSSQAVLMPSHQSDGRVLPIVLAWSKRRSLAKAPTS